MLVHEDGGMMGQFVVVDPSADVSEQPKSKGFVLFPNPVNSVYLTAKLFNINEKIHSYAIINDLGQILAYHRIDNNELSNLYSFPVFEYSKGTYILKIYTDNQLYSKKFVID
jgi:hypothetical protein